MHTAHSLEPLEARIAPARVFAIDTGNHLVSFDSATPGTLSAPIAITGLASGGLMTAIDFSPLDGSLFGVACSDNGNNTFTGAVYRLDPVTGAATALGQNFANVLSSVTGLDCDIDPFSGQLRVINASAINARVSLADGSLVTVDANLTGLTTPAGIAYSSSYA